MTPSERLSAAIHLESAAIAPQTSELIEAAKEALREIERLQGSRSWMAAIVRHWDEFGPEGLDEIMFHARNVVKFNASQQQAVKE